MKTSYHFLVLNFLIAMTNFEISICQIDKVFNQSGDDDNFQEIIRPNNKTNQMLANEQMSISDKDGTKLINQSRDNDNVQEIILPGKKNKEMITNEQMSISDKDGTNNDDEELEDVMEVVEREEELEGKWTVEALLDVAYYLRSHKFNEFDRRYVREENVQNENKYFYTKFPEPPLRHHHWEVFKYCSINLLSCLKYLHRITLDTNLQRTSDTSVLIETQGWNWEENKETILIVDKECERLKELDWKTAEPFQGPLERFQWRTTASYFMCLYTLKSELILSTFGEKCDNFANCLDAKFGESNSDLRANDTIPFACAKYSFCPDPCCPRKHIQYETECHLSADYPCWNNSEVKTDKCNMSMEQNTDLASIIYNRWNVTCICRASGFIWNSQFGICVDKNECIEGIHTCDEKTELCFNTIGSYGCCCKWGFEYETNTRKCVPSQALNQIINRVEYQKTQEVIIKHENQSAQPISAMEIALTVYYFLKSIFHMIV